MQNVYVFKDDNTGDVLIRLFLIQNEYINKQDWLVGPNNFDRNVQRSTGHDLVMYPVTLKDGRQILDHPEYKTATASEINDSLANQQKYSIGKAVLNKKYSPSKYHAIYRITDPDAAKWFIENSDDQGNLKVPIFTSPGILYTDKTKYGWENWIITHNAIVTKPANKEIDAGFFKSCVGDLNTTCQAIAASALTPCMLEGAKIPPALVVDGTNIVPGLLNTLFIENTSQESNQQKNIIMSNQGSNSTDQSSTGTMDLNALIGNNANLNLDANQLKQLAADLKVPEQLVTSFVDYRTKYNDLLKKQNSNDGNGDNNNDGQNKTVEDNNQQKKPIPQENGESEPNNNKEVSAMKAELELIKRENAIQKMLPTVLYEKQEDYDKDLEKYVKSNYNLSDLKEIIGVKIEKFNLDAEKKALKAGANQGNNPQPNSAIASLFGGSFNNPGVNYGTASAPDSDNKKGAVDINTLPHIRLARSLLLNNTFGDLV